MRKLTLSLFVLVLCSGLFAQDKESSRRILNCNVCVTGGGCSAPFNLVAGNTYTFTTDIFTGAFYNWSVTGGLSIVGARNQSSVQVLVSGAGQICITKSLDGQGACCNCYDVTVGQSECPMLFNYELINNPEIPFVWCSDAAANFLRFNFLPTNGSNTATVTFRDANFNIVQQYTQAYGGVDIGFPNGVPLSNQNPPPPGDYWVLIVNDCNPQDVIGGHFEVVSCNFGKMAAKKPSTDLKFEVYPNPVSNNNLNVRLTEMPAEYKKNNSKLLFRLLDAGITKQVGSWTFDASLNDFKINTRGISKGIYFLVATIGDRTVTKKIIIQ
jgi:hypothetical protein